MKKTVITLSIIALFTGVVFGAGYGWKPYTNIFEMQNANNFYPKPHHPHLLGDVNDDGVVDSTDALAILSYDAGIDTPYPIGEPVCR